MHNGGIELTTKGVKAVPEAAQKKTLTISLPPSFRNYVPSLQTKPRRFVAAGRLTPRSRFLLAFDGVQGLLNLIACILYVYETYVEDRVFPPWIVIVESLLAAMFIWDLILYFRVTLNKVYFFLDISTWFKVLSILPSFFIATKVRPFWGFLRLLRAFRILRVLELKRVFSLHGSEEDGFGTVISSQSEVQRQIASMIYAVFCLMFIAAGVVQHLFAYDSSYFSVPEDSELDFFTGFYYVTVTSFTIGYGDIIPQRWLPRFVVICIIMTFAVLIADHSSKLSALLARTSRYEKGYTSAAEHVVVTSSGGLLRDASLLRFLVEFYHADHGKRHSKIVLVGTREPSTAVITLLESTMYGSRVQYIKGRFNKKETLIKAGVRRCKAVFIFSDPFASNQLDSDAQAMMLAKVVNQHCEQVKTYVQVFEPESLLHSCWVPWTACFSVKLLKLGFISKEVLMPGLSVFLSNLIATRGTSEYNVRDAGGSEQWIHEYIHGAGQEVYTVKLSPFFYGKTTFECAAFVYQHSGLCMLRVESASDHRKSMLSPHGQFDDAKFRFNPEKRTLAVIRPADYVVQEGDRGFFIGPDQHRADIYENFDPSPVDIEQIQAIQQYESKGESVDIRLPAFPDWKCSAQQRTYSVKESIRGLLCNHILYCGSVDHFSYFINPLRAVSDQPVVILHTHLPELDFLMQWTNVFFVYGSSIRLFDLERTGFRDCHTAVVLSHPETDTTAIVTVSLISANSDCRVVCEMTHETSVPYLPNPAQDLIQELPYFCWPQMSSGNVVCPVALDTLLSQAYYNQHLITVLMRMVHLDQVAKEIQGALPRADSTDSYMIQLPPDFVGQTYGQLFLNLLLSPHRLLPMGLYRRAGWQGCTMPYLYTNPPKEALLAPGDLVLVLGDPQTAKPASKVDLSLDTTHTESSRFFPPFSFDEPRFRHRINSVIDFVQEHLQDEVGPEHVGAILQENLAMKHILSQTVGSESLEGLLDSVLSPKSTRNGLLDEDTDSSSGIDLQSSHKSTPSPHQL